MNDRPERTIDRPWLRTVRRALRSLYAAEPRPRPEPPPSGPARYTMLRELARGGMSRVLAVRDGGLDRIVAMKVGTRAHDEHGDVLAEARLIGRLEHPGIVPVHELGLDAEGRPYFTMRMVEGRTFADVLRGVADGEDGWSRARALEVVLRVCDTLSYAHRHGVVHCDLKPANVMVGEFGETYVVDWGLATALDAEGGARIAGTPSYMAPEQASGREPPTPAIDVYAVGALLYELLAGQPPFAARATPRSLDEMLATIREQRPTAIGEQDPTAPAALVAIAEKAMQREPSQRYPTVEALAADLRAYLEGRVVGAYRTGLGPELRMWLRRHRGLAAAVASLAVLATGATLWFVGALATERDLAATQADLAGARLREILDLSVLEHVKDLRRRADEELWPAYPDKLASMREWLAEAMQLAPVREALRARLDEPGSSAGTATERRWYVRLLEQAVAELDAFSRDDGDAASPGFTGGSTVGAMRRRIARAERIAAQSVEGEHAATWAETAAAIAAAPAYRGLSLSPQIGLVPLGADPGSSLFEFADVQTGAPPRRGPDGRLAIDADSALVFVLLPGGPAEIGATPERDPWAESNEAPVYEVELAPFFASKWEMTQAQWRRVTGTSPSNHDERSAFVEAPAAGLHPVESVNWFESSTVLFRLGFALPTESQWEYACRAGSRTPWYCADEPAGLDAPVAGNLADSTAHDALGSQCWAVEPWLRDGFVMHAPVGSFPPNGFGLHDMIGNVHEWCRDEYLSYAQPPRGADGGRPLSKRPAIAMYRGGAFDQRAVEARSANRAGRPPDARLFSLGVRPVRAVR